MVVQQNKQWEDALGHFGLDFLHSATMCFPSVLFSWMWYLRTTLRLFFQIWHKHPLNDELIRMWWSKVERSRSLGPHITCSYTRYEKITRLCLRLSNDVKWWHCEDILNTNAKGQRHWHRNALQNTFLAIMSCPKLSNRRRDCDQISHLVRCWIVDTNLGCPHWSCVDGVSSYNLSSVWFYEITHVSWRD